MPEPTWASSKTGPEPQYMKEIREQYGITGTTKETWAEITATYYRMITRLDDQFWRIMSRVEEFGHWDNTVTIFFTDHGGGPNPEGVINDMTDMVDLLPTVFELCGVPELYPHTGKSLMPLINLVPGYKHKELAFSEGGFLLEEKRLLEKGMFPYDLEWTHVRRLYEMGELYDRKNNPKEGKRKLDESQTSIPHVSTSEHWW
ncbi:hypothetical protein ACKRZS_001907 [Fusarium odoratissimum]